MPEERTPEKRMAENLRARDLMLASFQTVPTDQTLREAMNALIEAAADPRQATALVVVNADGSYRGLLTPRLLFRVLLSLWMPAIDGDRDEERLQVEMLDVVQDRFHLRVTDALMHGLAMARPDDRLVQLIDRVCATRMEFIPVVDDNRAVGLVPVTAIFQAAATLALTPDQKGIRHE